MRILALDSALARCSATLVSGDQVVSGRQKDMDRGHASALAIMTRDVLDDAAIKASSLDLITVTVGPGSFTGIRSGLALALGIGMATSTPVVGVTVGEALTDSLPSLRGRALWCAVPSRRGRVFLEIGEDVLSLAVTDLPLPGGPVAIAGSAALDVASRLASRGANVMLTDARLPIGRHIALVGQRRFRGGIKPLPTVPLYVDAPEAKPPAEGFRPPPIG
ncbi:tRNA (adenosine(37)-N6)-threonylcarbamoyltransferase complex dimerization subunit type 1 TsaB [Rhodopila sp.]|uniref:tRNA (adenosine(37)-N6)-threonylcarbamoyltransferase complex dimerization subunit type 1 TsaB n=1 Tax=Rhodopila sp. TaxID=2480087 RepID=UPI003D12EDF2